MFGDVVCVMSVNVKVFIIDCGVNTLATTFVRAFGVCFCVVLYVCVGILKVGDGVCVVFLLLSVL